MTNETRTDDLPNATSKPLAAVVLLPEEELKAWLSEADRMLRLSEKNRSAVFEKIKSSVSALQSGIRENSQGLTGFINEIFTLPDDEKLYLKVEPDCDQACTRQHNRKVIEKMQADSINIALGVFSPATKLKLFGARSLVEGKLLGEGKDAIVYTLKGDSDWVIKVLKFGGAERAELMQYYINQLAADAKLKVPPVTSLGDGRLLQPFVEGTAKANSLWGKDAAVAQELAAEMTHRAKQILGIKEGDLYINHPKIRIGIDPSYANFHFDEQGIYKGWIDPLYHLEQHAPTR